jgi:hypothetical protein
LGGRVKLNSEGNVVLEVDGDVKVKGGVILDSQIGDRPECDESRRGMQWFSKAEEGNDDELSVCERSGEGDYEWRLID